MQPTTSQLTQLINSSAQIAQRKPEAIALLNQVYSALFSQSIQQGCGNCYQKAFYRIQKHLYLQHQNDPLNNPIIMSDNNRQYLLKPDASLQTVFGGDTITNDNLTDDLAESLLKEFPMLLKHFVKFPGVEKVVNVVEDAVGYLEKGSAIAQTVAGLAEVVLPQAAPIINEGIAIAQAVAGVAEAVIPKAAPKPAADPSKQ
jgi:hypothetical protein